MQLKNNCPFEWGELESQISPFFMLPSSFKIYCAFFHFYGVCNKFIPTETANYNFYN